MILSSRRHKSVRYFSLGKNCISKNELYVQPQFTGSSIIAQTLLNLITVMKEKHICINYLYFCFNYA